MILKDKKQNLTQELMKDILYNSFCQAIIKLTDKSHISLKIILFFFIFVSTSLASYMVIEAILYYFDYDVTTTSRVIYERPSYFPKVTLCNQNMFTTEYAYEFAKSINSSWNIYTNKDTLYNLSFAERYTKRVYFFNLVLGNVFNYRDKNQKNLGHNFDDILLSCYFNNQICNANDFKWKFDPLYGNCYEFNADARDIKQSTIPGWINGLMLELYVNFNENLNEFNSVYGGYGAIVRLDNSSYSIDHGLDGIQVEAGTNSFIVVDRSFKFMLPKPYSNCEIDSSTPKVRNDSELFNLIAKSEYDYTQALCFSQCYQRESIRKCGFPDLNFLSLFPVNNTFSRNEDYTCVDNVYCTKYLSSDFLRETCLPLCPLECNRTEYRASVTASQLIGDIYVDYIKRNKNLSSDFINRSIDLNTAARSVVKMNIFYESMSYTLVTESPKMNVVSLLASIGGNLGLFLGVSVFSLCEIIELVIRIYFIKNEQFGVQM
jgi:hypothetical protein